MLAGNTPVLVHNCGPDLDALSASGRNPANSKSEMNAAGNAYAKHMKQPGVESSKKFLQNVKGGNKVMEEHGENLLDDILTDPRGVHEMIPLDSKSNFPGGLRVIRPDGVGAVFDSGGQFKYFGQFMYQP